jgi:hypothetical protein
VVSNNAKPPYRCREASDFKHRGHLNGHPRCGTVGLVFRGLRSLASFLIIPVLLNSGPVMQCASSVFSMLNEIAQAQSGVPDCCKNGMCPMHHHHGDSQQSSEDPKCPCQVASQPTVANLVLAQTPAISTNPTGAVQLTTAGWNEDSLTPHTLHMTLTIEPPPPRL